MAFGGNDMKRSSVFEWHTRFEDGQKDVMDDSRSGQPKATITHVNATRVLDVIRKGC